MALKAARQTGHFELLTRTEHRAARAEALKTCQRVDATITKLRAAAMKEKQMARQIELNTQIQMLQKQRQQATAKL